MSLQSVRQFLADHAPDIEIIELNQSTATVELAAKAHNVEPGQIAKTLSLKVKTPLSRWSRKAMPARIIRSLKPLSAQKRVC